jgi:hypothetical protein
MPGARPRFVFACFKRIERCGDWVTGAAGPFFVAAATVLFILGTLCFRMSLIFIFFKALDNDSQIQSTSSCLPFRGHGCPFRRAS